MVSEAGLPHWVVGNILSSIMEMVTLTFWVFYNTQFKTKWCTLYQCALQRVTLHKPCNTLTCSLTLGVRSSVSCTRALQQMGIGHCHPKTYCFREYIWTLFQHADFTMVVHSTGGSITDVRNLGTLTRLFMCINSVNFHIWA